MDGVYSWARNLAGFFLFMSVLGNLLPGKKYEKYIRMFAGMVLILLVIKPLAGGLDFEEILARIYEAELFQEDAADLKVQILGVEDRRLSEAIARYEDAVENDVGEMAKELGFLVEGCRVDMEKDKEKEEFGMVARVWLQVAEEGKGTGGLGEPVEAVNPMGAMETISPVVIGERPFGEKGPGEKEEEGRKQYPTVEKLRKKIASFYNLEEAYVEIQVVER